MYEWASVRHVTSPMRHFAKTELDEKFYNESQEPIFQFSS